MIQNVQSNFGFLDYGTNGGSALTRPDSAPSTGSEAHVLHTEYDTYDRAYKSTNPNGIVTEQFFDDLGRSVKTIEDYTGSALAETDTQHNRTTEVTYDTAGRQSTLVALNPKGSGHGIESQTTTYVYGTATGGASPVIYRNDVLRAVIYPDSDDTTSLGNGTDGIYDRVEYTYDVLGRKATMKDQNGTVHTYVYDSGGRFQQDQVTTLGTNIDGTVRRIQLTCDDRGRTTNITSYDSTSGGTVLNEVKYTYADSNWGQITKIEQNDTGAVGGGTPAIDYTYDDGAVSGAAKYLRRTSVTYPGPSTRRAIYYNYPSSGDGSVLSRLDNIADSGAGTIKYVQYAYLGASAISKLAHPSVTYGLDLTYDPSANGTFTNLDQFGQITKQSWNVAGGDADPFTYGYDYNGNRTYRGDTGFPADQLYTYDTLDRLIDMQQGTLNSTNTGFTGTVAKEEQFTLDELGNWPEYLTKASGTTNLDQTRAHTAANETGTITHVTGATWVSPTYDLAGNMVSGPKPASPTTNLKFIYDGWNRMVQVQDNSSTIIATYRYDGQNHRIQKLLGSNPSSPTSYYDYYYNENWQVLEERLNGSGTSLNAQYIWDIRYIDAPVVRFDGSTAIYYCEDANMNVTSLTDHFGLVVERYTYDAYGQIHFFGSDLGSPRSSSANGNEILFGGYRYDTETGLYHVRNRMYHPTLGKWASRDPIGYGDGDNLYEAVKSNPTISSDPLGLARIVFIFEGLGGGQQSDAPNLGHLKKDNVGLGAPRALTMFQEAGFSEAGTVAGLSDLPSSETIYYYFPWEGGYTGSGQRDHAVAVAKSLKLDQKSNAPGCEYHTLTVIGHSFGGDSAWDFAAKLLKGDADTDSKRKDHGIKVNFGFTMDPRPIANFPLNSMGDSDLTASWKRHGLSAYHWINFYRPFNPIPNVTNFHGFQLPIGDNIIIHGFGHMAMTTAEPVVQSFKTNFARVLGTRSSPLADAWK